MKALREFFYNIYLVEKTENEFRVLGKKNRTIKTKLSLIDIEKLKLLAVYNIELSELLEMIKSYKKL